MQRKKRLFKHSAAIACMVTAAFWVILPCQAQVIIQGSDGTDLLVQLNKQFNGGVNLLVNTSKESIAARTYLQSGTAASPKFHIIELGAAATNGVGTIFSNRDFNPGTSLSYAFVKTDLLTTPGSNDIDWWSAGVGYDVNRFTLFNSDTTFSEQVTKQDFRGLSVVTNYSRLIRGAYVLSVTAGYEKSNNYQELKKVEIRESESFTSTDGGTARLVNRTRTARQGAYKEFDTYPTRFSFTYRPPDSKPNKILFGLSVYGTRRFTKEQTTSNIGFNLFVTKFDTKTGSRSAVLAFFVEGQDFFDERKIGNTLDDRIVIGVTTNLALFKF